MFLSKRQFNGVPFDGIIFQKAQRVSAPDRGIYFERPDRYLVNTPVGQLEISQGDWVVEFSPGRMYIIRGEDMRVNERARRVPRAFWQFWRKHG
jgi:hypothetical protein